MAKGTVTIFEGFELDKGTGVHDLSSDTIKVALVDSTLTPLATILTPTWSDFSANECSGDNYTAGGETVGSVTWTLVANKPELGGDDVGWTIHATGPDDARWAIIYNDTAASKNAIGFVDFGEVVSLQADNIDVEWSGSVIHRVSPNAVAV